MRGGIPQKGLMAQRFQQFIRVKYLLLQYILCWALCRTRRCSLATTVDVHTLASLQDNAGWSSRWFYLFIVVRGQFWCTCGACVCTSLHQQSYSQEVKVVVSSHSLASLWLYTCVCPHVCDSNEKLYNIMALMLQILYHSQIKAFIVAARSQLVTLS